MGARYLFLIAAVVGAVVGCGRTETPGGPAVTAAPARAAATVPATVGARAVLGTQVGSTQTSATRAMPRVVYVLDHSGSLLDNFEFLQKEVKRSVEGLGSGQMFGVIVFGDLEEEGAPILTPGKALVRATAEAKRAAGAKMDHLQARGTTCGELSPYLDAFKEAFAMKPDVIYFLTNERFGEKLIGEVRKLNAGETKVRINTIAFVGPDDGYFDQMRQISAESGGTFKYVSEKEVAVPGWWPEAGAATTQAATTQAATTAAPATARGAP